MNLRRPTSAFVALVAFCCFATLARANEDQVDYNAFLQWLRHNGAGMHPNITIRESEDRGVGLFTNGTVNADLLFTIPVKLHLNLETILEDNDFLELLVVHADFEEQWQEEKVSSELMTSLFASYLAIYSENQTHHWYPYFKTLPKTCQSVVCWEDHQIFDALTPLGYGVVQEQIRYYTQFANLLDLDPIAFLQKVSLVVSRAFSSEGGILMIPLADSANHDPQLKSSIVLGMFRIAFTAQNSYESDSEILHSYQLWQLPSVFFNHGLLMDMALDASHCPSLRAWFSAEYCATHVPFCGDGDDDQFPIRSQVSF
jgi:hypothetical protein